MNVYKSRFICIYVFSTFSCSRNFLKYVAGRQVDFVPMILTYKAIWCFYYVLNHKLLKISTHYIFCIIPFCLAAQNFFCCVNINHMLPMAWNYKTIRYVGGKDSWYYCLHYGRVKGPYWPVLFIRVKSFTYIYNQNKYKLSDNIYVIYNDMW